MQNIFFLCACVKVILLYKIFLSNWDIKRYFAKMQLSHHVIRVRTLHQKKNTGMTVSVIIGLLRPFPPYPFLLSFPQSSQTSTTVIHFLYFPPITNKTWVISYNPIKFCKWRRIFLYVSSTNERLFSYQKGTSLPPISQRNINPQFPNIFTTEFNPEMTKKLWKIEYSEVISR